MHPVSDISTRVTQAELDTVRQGLDWAWAELETSASPEVVAGVKKLRLAREAVLELQDRLNNTMTRE